ncbi:SMR family transporter [Lachnospiraceae bacterium ZAX-1]
MKGWLYLAGAIVFEVIGAFGLQKCRQFTALVPSMITIVAYAISFYIASMATKTFAVGALYAYWCAGGIVLTVIVEAIWTKQIPDFPAILGLVFIIIGIVIINLFSKSY